MPKIKVDNVLTFTSEDPHHPASNILNSDPGRKWKCARTGEKTASVVLQLEKAMQITGIDIGNENSAYIEVLVSRSSSNEFKPLLGMSAFMSPLEARNHQNINKVRMFTSSDFSMPEGNEKWDQIKFVCVQPYNKHVQYGLSFVTIHTNEGAGIDGKKNVGRFTLRPDSPTRFSVGNLFSNVKEGLNASPSLKGAAAIREASTNPLQSQYKSPIIKRTSTASPKPSTSKDTDTEEPTKEKNRNRNNLLYDEEDEAPNDKIDRVIEKKKQEDAEKLKNKEYEKKASAKTPKTHKNVSNSSKTGDSTNSPTKKRKTDSTLTTLGSESPKSPKKRRTTDVLKDLNSTSPKAGPSSLNSSPSPPRPKRRSSVDEKNENVSPKKKVKVSTKTDSRHERKPYEKLLDGVIIAISGIQNPERANIRTSALAMGARYKADWDSNCTHLICAFANTPKFHQVRGKGKIVKKQWITECEKQRKRLPWRRFCLDRKDMTGIESEDEIWEQVDVSDSGEQEQDELDGDDQYVAANASDIADNEDTDEEIERIQQQQIKQEKVRNRRKDEQEETEELKNGNVNNSVIKMKKVSKDFNYNEGDLPVLPDYFSGLTFYLSENLEALRGELTRYIIGYAGKIVEHFDDIDNTVFAITYSDDTKEIQALRKHTDRLISPTWLLECHNKKRLLPFDDFLL